MPLNEDNSVLSAFREMGYTPTFSRKRGTRGNPESLKSLTEKFLSKLRAGNSDLSTLVKSEWDAIVGGKFAGKCAPQNIRAGILYISALNPSVKQELLFNQHRILAYLQKLEGGTAIKKLRIL